VHGVTDAAQGILPLRAITHYEPSVELALGAGPANGAGAAAYLAGRRRRAADGALEPELALDAGDAIGLGAGAGAGAAAIGAALALE
jgi:hypothetical protein